MSGARATDSSEFTRIVGDIELTILNAFQEGMAPDFITLKGGKVRPAKWLVYAAIDGKKSIIYKAHTKSDAIQFLTERETSLKTANNGER